MYRLFICFIVVTLLTGCASIFVREPGGDPDRFFVDTGYCNDSNLVKYGLGVRF